MLVKKYRQYLKKLEKHHYQLAYLDIPDQVPSSNIMGWIDTHYDDLSDYRDCILVFHAPINWLLIAKVAIYMENFRMEHDFPTFERYRAGRIKALAKFLKHNPYIMNAYGLNKIIRLFYRGVSYGFQFKDLFIGSCYHRVVLVMQKVDYDKTRLRCPLCFSKNVHSNSCSQFLMQSFECNNPKCPKRSKHNRGKRFDLLSTKRQMELERNDPKNRISNHLWTVFRRDIVPDRYLTMLNLLKLYSWDGDCVLTNIDRKRSYRGRSFYLARIYQNETADFSFLPVVRLLTYLKRLIIFHKAGRTKVERVGQSLVAHDNCANLNRYHVVITSALTSPPYYNARKYSHWSSFLAYLIDMLIDMAAVYQQLQNHSVYIYNVGDIVSQENTYVTSHMSTLHLALGFYSILLAHLVGYRVDSDIIWDKGEVQSERHFSHHFAGYAKPMNCYEHCLVLSKGKPWRPTENRIARITPVRKINAHGQNVYGHSAPFPKGIAELIVPYLRKGYILDPFLGSGTTSIVANSHHTKSIGFEINQKYYQLSLKRIREAMPHES